VPKNENKKEKALLEEFCFGAKANSKNCAGAKLNANIVGNNIARQVEGKIAYRRAIKMAVANTMRAGAEGIKVQITGR